MSQSAMSMAEMALVVRPFRPKILGWYRESQMRSTLRGSSPTSACRMSLTVAMMTSPCRVAAMPPAPQTPNPSNPSSVEIRTTTFLEAV